MNELGPYDPAIAQLPVATPRFSAVPLLYCMMVVLLAASAAYSVSLYLSWWVALPIGLALAYAFSALVKVIAAPTGEASVAWRATCVVAAFFIFGITSGLSSATLYQKFIAKTSAIGYFEKVSLPALRRLESLRGDAEAAAQALRAWSEHSEAKAAQEGKPGGGGTCPARAESLGKRGPIAMFREGEAAIAADLHKMIHVKVTALGAGLQALGGTKPANFEQVAAQIAQINKVSEASQALAHGAFVRSAQETLQRQADAKITWANREQFQCGDTARDELIAQAQGALASLERSEPIAPLTAAIDLANPQAAAIRSLLRSFNLELMLATAGWAGQFEDDPLMKAALKKGAVNDETISLLLATVLEASVIVFAMLMARRGMPVYRFEPAGLFAPWQAIARDEPRAALRFLHGMGLSCARLLMNLFWSYPATSNRPAPAMTTAGTRHAQLQPETNYPARELRWGLSLAPYLVSVHDGHYVCVPAGRDRRGSLAAQALAHRGAVELISSGVALDLIARHNRAGAMQLVRLVPDANATSWELYRLTPDFAQAMRVQLLEPPVGSSVPAAGSMRP